MKLRFILGVFAFTILNTYSQWHYSEKLHLLAGPDIVEAGAKYEVFYGEQSLQAGARAHGVIDSKNEDAWSALALLKFTNEFEAFTLGSGFQRLDPSFSASPVVELTLTPWYEGLSRTQLYGQYEWEGVGVGFGVRLEWITEISPRLDADLFVDASWFEERKEDIDGYGAVFIEPSSGFDTLHLGPAVWLDEDEVTLAFMFMIRP